MDNPEKTIEELTEEIVNKILVGIDNHTRQHYTAIIRNYLNECKNGVWGKTSWRTAEWIGSHTPDELFEDWTVQFMAIQPMVYPYPLILEASLIRAIMETGRYLKKG